MHSSRFYLKHVGIGRIVCLFAAWLLSLFLVSCVVPPLKSGTWELDQEDAYSSMIVIAKGDNQADLEKKFGKSFTRALIKGDKTGEVIKYVRNTEGPKVEGETMGSEGLQSVIVQSGYCTTFIILYKNHRVDDLKIISRKMVILGPGGHLTDN
jgi:hypothetical protein